MVRDLIKAPWMHVVLALVVTLSSASLPAVSAQSTPTAPPHAGRSQLSRSPLASATARSQQAVSASLFPWSRVVYQTFGNNNWEIYIANDDGTNPLRLTNSGDPDIHPRLNRGADRVVHASKTGDYEIRTLNTDGSAGMTLTDNDQDDVSPAWSPDGNRIAFQSYRDGQAEIYVMNADGSNPTRLTGSADYDGEPIWSPDGSKIAFISRRTGHYRLWVMNADGGGQVMLSIQNYSADPTWSPDGSQIAYDADGNGDGWQELWVMNADGGNQHSVMAPSNNTDAWAGSWSPDGRYIAYTLISFVFYQGNWYWTAAYLEAFDTLTGATFRLSTDDTAWSPDWQSFDISAPASAMTPLPTTSPSPIRVSWSGSDAGVSGLRNYDVQVKDGAGGAWVNWLPQTTQTTGDYPGIGGHTYYFRTRARDNSSNLEAWPASYDAATTAEALPPVTAITSLPAFARGALTVQWGGVDPGFSGVHTYDVQHRVGAGGSWQDWQMGTANTQATFAGTPGQTYYFRARATDRAQNVEDWPPGDGDGQVTFYDWQLTGTVRDNAGAPVGDAQTTLTPAGLASLASNVSGNYTVYAISNTIGFAANWSKSGYGILPATGFSGTVDGALNVILPPSDNVIANPGFEAGNTSWLINGSAVSVVTDSIHHTGARALVLGQPQTLFTSEANITAGSPAGSFVRLRSGSDGRLHALWLGSALLYARRNPGQTWEAPEPVPNGPAGFRYRYPDPQIEVDAYDGVHFLWASDPVPDVNVYYAYRSPGGSWTQAYNVTNTSTRAELVGLATDPLGRARVVWIEEPPQGSSLTHRLYHRVRGADGVWGAGQAIATAGKSRVTYPAFAVEDDGTLHLAWIEQTYIYGENQLYYMRKPMGEGWSIPLPLSDSNYAEGLVMRADGNGMAHLVYSDRPLSGWASSTR